MNLFNICQSRPPLPLFSSFSHQNVITNWKKLTCCAWDSNSGPQDGKHSRIHWARNGGRQLRKKIVTLALKWPFCFRPFFGEIPPMRFDRLFDELQNQPFAAPDSFEIANSWPQNVAKSSKRNRLPWNILLPLCSTCSVTKLVSLVSFTAWVTVAILVNNQRG